MVLRLLPVAKGTCLHDVSTAQKKILEGIPANAIHSAKTLLNIQA